MGTKIVYQKRMKSLLLISFLSLFSILSCQKSYDPAQNISLNSFFTDNMVLQQKQDVPIWGTAEPGGEVIVTLNKQQKKSIVNDDGNWRVDLSPVTAGGPYELKVIGQDTIIYENVMVGEVWLCSGQSNMEMPLAGWGEVINYEQEIAEANYPDIRLFQFEHTMSAKPSTKINSDGWKQCAPSTIPEFSSTAYFFGRAVHKKLNIPIGLIHSSWGGTVVEAWTSADSLRVDPDFAEIIAATDSGGFTEENYWAVFKEKLDSWTFDIQQKIDSLGGYDHGWEKQDFNSTGWETMELPTVWEKAGLDVDGVVWFRKEIEIPSLWEGQNLTLSLGQINDCDVTWFNGKKVGSEGHHMIPRVYQIPDSLVRAGRNVIAVQVIDIGNKGGLYGDQGQLKIKTASQDSISLAGAWRYKVDPLLLDVKEIPHQPNIPHSANRPTILYNGMIAPLIPFAIRGAIWYQGEGNSDRAYQYRRLFKTLIQDWRSHWNQGDFPFLFVQLANFMNTKPEPEEAAWAELREAQLMALSLPNTGMAVAIDIGDAIDIHPKNKQEVGKRLALNALNLVYDQEIEYSGPIYKSKTIEGNKIRLFFDHADNGLTTPDNEELKGFAIAGSDKKFHWAQAEIDSNSIVVWNDKIKNPLAVRYAWASNPACNLYNKAGLPASPFRTDEWLEITKNKK